MPALSAPWTQFHDMHSGGRQNTKWAQIFVEAPEKEAREIFIDRVGEYPDAENCDCCGANYSVTEAESLEQATAYERGCLYDGNKGAWVETPETKWGNKRLIPLAEYVKREDVLILRAPDFAMPPIGTGEEG